MNLFGHGSIVGPSAQLSEVPLVWVVYFYGTKGRVPPGWYLVNRWWELHGIPLAGPFDDQGQATREWFRHADLMPREPGSLVPDYGRLAYRAVQTLVLNPVLFLKPEHITMGPHSRVDSFVKIEGGDGVFIGRNVHIASYCHVNIGGGVTILEDGSSMGSGAKVLSGSAVPDAPSCSATSPDAVNVKKVTRLCEGATLYVNAVVLPGLTIGPGARVAAGAVVTCDVPGHELWAGIPARKVRIVKTGRHDVEQPAVEGSRLDT